MNFGKALEALKAGSKVKLPSWAGYWQKEGDTIMMHCKDGQVLDIRETKDVFYTLGNIASEDWEIMDEEYKADLDIHTFRFGEALQLLKQGKRLTRRGWNGKGLFVVYQKGYPQGIPCNKQTAEAWGLKEGELFKCEPYLQISTVDGSHAMWVPSIRECLADDWILAEDDQEGR